MPSGASACGEGFVLPGGRVIDALMREPPFADRQCQLQDQQLLIDEAAFGLLEACFVARRVNLWKGCADRQESMGVEKFVAAYPCDWPVRNVVTTPKRPSTEVRVRLNVPVRGIV